MFHPYRHLLDDLESYAPGVKWDARIMPNGWLIATGTFACGRKISFCPAWWSQAAFQKGVDRAVSAWIENQPYRRFKKNTRQACPFCGKTRPRKRTGYKEA